MASSGKSEIMAGVFAAASNDFMTERHSLESKETHQESDEEERAADNNDDKERTTDPTEDEPTRRKRGNF